MDVVLKVMECLNVGMFCFEMNVSVDSSCLYTRRRCVLAFRQGGAPEETHRLRQRMPESAMKHRHCKAVFIAPDHDGRVKKLCRGSRNFPKAQRNTDRSSEA